MIVLHARLPLAPETRDAALDAIEDVMEHSRAEAGMLDYRAAVELDDPNAVVLYQRYEDEAAFQAHFDSEHFAAFERAIHEYLDDEPEVLRFDVESMTDLEAE